MRRDEENGAVVQRARTRVFLGMLVLSALLPRAALAEAPPPGSTSAPPAPPPVPPSAAPPGSTSAPPAPPPVPSSAAAPPVRSIPGSPPPPSTPVDAPPAASSPVVALRTPDARVILERRPIELDRRGDLAGVDGWIPVCIAPCGLPIRRDDRLRIAGSGVDPSEAFVLPPGPGPFTVHAVTTGSAASSTAGLVLVVTGGGMLALGGFSLIGMALTGASKNVEPDSIAAKLQTASITTVILGAVVFGAAVPFRFAQRTTVRIELARGARNAVGPRLEIGPGFVAF